VFSARLALSDPHDPASGWHDVQALVDRVLVGGERRLRERVLRHRAGERAHRLSQAAQAQAAAADARAETALREQTVLAERSAELRGRRHRAEEAVLTRLTELREELLRDLRPLAGLEAEASARRFASQRARQILGPALSDAAVNELGELSGPLRQELKSTLVTRAGALAAALGPGVADPGQSRALAELVIDELERVVDAQLARPSTIVVPGWVRRARALSDVFVNGARAEIV
jgi:hypothetical protein